MAKHKLEVTLKGEFTTVDVTLEGIEIPLREIKDNVYHRLYSHFEILNPLDIFVKLKGWTGQDWSILIKVDDQEKFKEKGTFDSKGFAKISEQVQIQE